MNGIIILLPAALRYSLYSIAASPISFLKSTVVRTGCVISGVSLRVAVVVGATGCPPVYTGSCPVRTTFVVPVVKPPTAILSSPLSSSGSPLATIIKSSIPKGKSSGIVASSLLPICPIASILFRPILASCRKFISFSSPWYLVTSSDRINSPSLTLASISSRTPSRVPPIGTLLPDSSSTIPPSSFKPPRANSSICFSIMGCFLICVLILHHVIILFYVIERSHLVLGI